MGRSVEVVVEVVFEAVLFFSSLLELCLMVRPRMLLAQVSFECLSMCSCQCTVLQQRILYAGESWTV